MCSRASARVSSKAVLSLQIGSRETNQCTLYTVYACLYIQIQGSYLPDLSENDKFWKLNQVAWTALRVGHGHYRFLLTGYSGYQLMVVGRPGQLDRFEKKMCLRIAQRFWPLFRWFQVIVLGELQDMIYDVYWIVNIWQSYNRSFQDVGVYFFQIVY